MNLALWFEEAIKKTIKIKPEELSDEIADDMDDYDRDPYMLGLNDTPWRCVTLISGDYQDQEEDDYFQEFPDHDPYGGADDPVYASVKKEHETIFSDSISAISKTYGNPHLIEGAYENPKEFDEDLFYNADWWKVAYWDTFDKRLAILLTEWAGDGNYSIAVHGVVVAIKPIMPKKLQTKLNKLVATDPSLEVLDLEDSNIIAFPEILRSFENLRILRLSKNPIGQIPSWIDTFKNLEELHVSKCQLAALPKELTKLKNLKVVNASYNWRLKLPKSIGKCTSLQELHLDECNLKNLPKEIGNLKNLKVLSVNNNLRMISPEIIGELTSLETLHLNRWGSSRHKPLPFPAFLLKLSGLKRLTLHHYYIDSLPEDFAKLTELEYLDLGACLSHLTAIPDLSPLTKLCTLLLSGHYLYEGNPMVQNHLKAFFACANLEQLDIDRYGKDVGYFGYKNKKKAYAPDPLYGTEFRVENDERNERYAVYYRESLTPSHLAGIKNLSKLKRINLSFNSLMSLPEEFFSLSALNEINIQSNNLTEETINRLLTAFPTANILR